MNPYEAFNTSVSTEELEAPLTVIKRKMIPTVAESLQSFKSEDFNCDITNNSDFTPPPSPPNHNHQCFPPHQVSGQQQQRHMPLFIPPASFLPCLIDDTIGKKVKLLRKLALRNEAGESLRVERSQSPSDVRWQVLPLMEGRVFRCTGIDDNCPCL